MRAKHIPRIAALAAVLLMSPPVLPAAEGYPKFSWDRVPVSAHVTIRDGLKPEQSKFLADHFDFITFTGGSEETTAATARAVKQRNSKAKVLMYLADSPRPQYTVFNATFPAGGYLEGDGKQWFDVSRQDVRDWWSDTAGKAVRDYACDGIFFDGATAGNPGEKWSRVFGPERAAVLDAGVFAMLKDTRRKMGPDKLIIFNPLHGRNGKIPPLGERYLPVTDGAMMDDFDRATNLKQFNKEYFASEIEEMSKAARAGKIIIFKGWPGFTWRTDPELVKKPHDEVHQLAAKRITFPLSCFLVAAETNSYFCYTWGWKPEYGTFDWYPEFDKPLGPPKGGAVRKGWTYTREFEHASVFVDLEKKTAKIEWH